MKNKRKGFTLIELLVTIAILSIMMIIGFFSIKAMIEHSKNESNKVTISNVNKSAISYTNEFKKQNRYWFEDIENDSEEYACTTVQMLINKGLLDESVIGEYDVDGKIISITADTSIKTIRDKTTKVVSDSTLIDDVACDEVDDLELEIKMPDPDGLDNWYKSNFNIEVDLKKTFSTGISQYIYGVYDDGKYIAIGSLSNPSEISTYNFKYNGNGISFCVDAVSNKEKRKRVCTDNFKVDTVSPIIDNLSIDNENIYSVSKTIKITKYTEKNSGIKEFQYYLTDSSNIPNVNTKITENLGLNVSKYFDYDMNGNYIYFRGIDNAGNIGKWSSPKRIYIDIKNPIINKKGDLYEVRTSDNTNIIENYFTYSPNGNGKITDKYCYITNANTKIYKISDLKVGTFDVTCEVVKENGLKSKDTTKFNIKQGYSCSIGTLYEKSKDQFICIASAKDQNWYSSSFECTGGTTRKCTNTGSKTVMDCDLCGVLNDTGSKECDACTDACGDNLSCLSACKSPCQDPCKTCTISTESCRDVCISFETIYTYYCKSGWNVYSGYDSSLKCYKNAEILGG